MVNVVQFGSQLGLGMAEHNACGHLQHCSVTGNRLAGNPRSDATEFSLLLTNRLLPNGCSMSIIALMPGAASFGAICRLGRATNEPGEFEHRTERRCAAPERA